MPATQHTSCQRGKRVLVILKSGERIVARFEERRGNAVVLAGGRRIKPGDIRAFALYREREP